MNYILRSELGATSAGTACVEYPFFRVAEKSDGAALAKSVACKEAHSTNRQIKRSHGELSIHRGFALFRGGFVPPLFYLLYCKPFMKLLAASVPYCFVMRL